MLDVVRFILHVLQGSEANTGGKNRFTALVLEARGERALLLWGGKRIWALPSAPVRVGERLFLERDQVVNGLLHCRIIGRLPASGTHYPVVQDPVASALLYTGEQKGYPYFLAVRKEAIQEIGEDGFCSLRITLQTRSIGLVVLLLSGVKGHHSAVLLVESEQARELLSSRINKLAGKLSASRPALFLQPVRVMTETEKNRYAAPGAAVDTVK